jgi:hypothetical protein
MRGTSSSLWRKWNDLFQMNAIWEQESNPRVKFTPAKSCRQHFASPVNPPTTCRWSAQAAAGVCLGVNGAAAVK